MHLLLRADGSSGSRSLRAERVNSLLHTRSRVRKKERSDRDLATNLFSRRAKTEDTPCRIMN